MKAKTKLFILFSLMGLNGIFWRITTVAENRKKGYQKHAELNILLIMTIYIMYQIRTKVMMRMVIMESVAYFMKIKQMK